jgi:GMP synthase-like glutamine amidotransferase
MFGCLFEKVLLKHAAAAGNKERSSCTTTTTTTTTTMKISITIYDAKQQQYPTSKEEWDAYHGIVISGSLSAAYEEKKYEWIQRLINEIQMNIHPYRRKTLGVCFGHQIYAHSFDNHQQHQQQQQEQRDRKNDDDKDNDVHTHIGRSGSGRAVQCPKGIQVGVHSFDCLKFNKEVASDQQQTIPTSASASASKLSMLYTHGDMVESIPNCATSLGGSEYVPIQACAYFSSDKEKKDYHGGAGESGIIPYAFTFQGHPEYASREVGLVTYLRILNFMDEGGKLEHDVLERANRDCLDQFDIVEESCVNIIHHVMLLLGWLS